MPPNNTKKLKPEPITHQVKKPESTAKGKVETKKNTKSTGFSGTGRLGLLVIGIAFALNKIYPTRHELFRKIFYPQKLVPERNDHYRIKDIWTPEQVEGLLELVKA